MEIQANTPIRLELHKTTSWDHSDTSIISNQKAYNTVCVLQTVCPNHQIIQILKIFLKATMLNKTNCLVTQVNYELID